MYVYVCVRAHEFVCMHAKLKYVREYAYMHACKDACMYAYIYMYVRSRYIHTDVFIICMMLHYGKLSILLSCYMTKG